MRITLATLLSILLSLTASVAAEPEKVSDTELRAAYCLAVVEGQQLNLANWMEQAVVGKSLIERRDRFRDYLLAKGFLGGRDPVGLTTAMRRGTADENQCDHEARSGEYKMCRDRCLAGITNDSGSETAQKAMQCAVRCPSPQACDRVGRCSEAFLPF
jgi:hypothetical protein